MATFGGDWPLESFALWNAISFVTAFLVVNSFVEWTVHRYVMHRPTIFRYPYRQHAELHHTIFDGGRNYHARNLHMLEHVRFIAADYLLFMLAVAPVWTVVELAVGRPVILGGMLAALAGLQTFNSLHLRFHVPRDTWFQRTRFFRFLKEHHRLHHDDQRFNFNVYFLPLADAVMGTWKR